MQTEEPYWLGEAYTAAISSQDVGAMQRNLVNCELTSTVINLLFPQVSTAIDYGAGHGVFVRLMRDKGFNFYWYDLHATNDYAKGFESADRARFDFLTAFEVLEHLNDPIAEFTRLMELSDNVFASTWLVPEKTPKLTDWWYYSPETGQHIAFYTRASLQALANKFGRNLLSIGPYHLFSKERKAPFLFQIATKFQIARIANRIYRRKSLIEDDHRRRINS